MKRILTIILACMLMAVPIGVSAEGTVDYVSEIGKYGIIKGDPDGSMRLSDNLSRGEAVTLLVRMYGFIPETSIAAPANEFSDMENHWAVNAVMIAKHLGITEANNSDVFNPDESINSEDFIKMTVLLLGYEEAVKQKGGENTAYLLQASQLGITKGVTMATGRYVKRSDAVRILYNCLDIPVMAQTSFSVTGENTYTILNGKNGTEYRSIRTTLQQR